MLYRIRYYKTAREFGPWHNDLDYVRRWLDFVRPHFPDARIESFCDAYPSLCNGRSKSDGYRASPGIVAF